MKRREVPNRFKLVKPYVCGTKLFFRDFPLP